MSKGFKGPRFQGGKNNKNDGKKMTEKFIRVETEQAVARLILNRPPANALDLELVEEFHRVLDRLEKNKDVRAVAIISEVEKVFIAGADIKMMHVREGEELVRFMDNYDSRLQQVTSRFEALPQPTIAVISGHALGGGLEFALACDFRFMSRGKATVGLPEANIGLFPAAGGTQRLSRVIGKARALELMIMGKALSADEALAVGLVHRVYEPEALRAESLKFAGELAERASLAIAAIKKCVRIGLDLPIQDGLKLELKEFLEVLRTGDAREGLDAFVNKRKPQFKGK